MKSLTINELNQLKPLEVLDNELVKERFINLHKGVHNNELGENFYQKEVHNFRKLILASKDLQQCTGFSIYGCLIDIATMGLSLDNLSKPLLYVLPHNVKVAENKYEKRAKLDISPYGELALRMQAGQVSHVDKPCVVYQGDSFQPYVKNGIKSVDYMPKIPRASKNIIACFIGITRPDGTRDFYWMLEEDINRLKSYSARKNKGEANSLYNSANGGIDSGFLEAKTIKHAFSCFPKIKVGQFSQISNEEIDPVVYGLNEEIKPENLSDKVGSFVEYQEDESETLTINDDSDIF
jgi:hypothetical protein